jgi:hypothetical protein
LTTVQIALAVVIVVARLVQQEDVK